MSIRITKEKAIKDTEAFINQTRKGSCENFTKDQVLKILEDVRDEIEHIDTTRTNIAPKEQSEVEKKLKKQNKELTVDRWNLVSKINDQNNELKDYRKRGFCLTKKQKEAADKWWKNHCENNHKNASFGVNGGGRTFLFTPTSIGTVVELQCSCGAHCQLPNDF